MKANTEGINAIKQKNILDNEVNPATEDTLQGIADDVRPLAGTGVSGTRELTLADTWYAVPSTVPSADYLLVISKENAAGQLRFSFSNASAPSATFGNKFNNEDIVVELAANEVLYISSTVAGDDVNWSTKEI